MLATLDIAAFERVEPHRFVCRSPAPTWLENVLPVPVSTDPIALADHFLFLNSFLERADALWDGPPAPDEAHTAFDLPALQSEPWAEYDDDGNEHLLEATALRDDQTALLLLRPASVDPARHRAVLQEGRSLNLAHQQTQDVLHRYEVVLECLFHDLSEPLANLQDALSLLGDVCDAPDDLLELSRRSGDELKTALQEALGDIRATFQGDNGTTADLAALSRELVSDLRPRATAADRDIQLADDLQETSVDVVASPTRLQRVLRSLLEHGLRRTPEGGTVGVSVQHDARNATMEVTDDGPPLPKPAASSLFDRAGPRPLSDASSLGLYFARIAAEAWGGAVGYRCDSAPTVWLRLPAAEQA
jgi:signal transduction histidine kinase